MTKSYNTHIFAKPDNTEQPLVSGMPCPAMLCPILATNIISETQGYVTWRLHLLVKRQEGGRRAGDAIAM